MHEAVVFFQPLDLLVVIILHHCFQTAVISGSGLKVGVVSQKYSSRKKNPPFKILDPPLDTVNYVCSTCECVMCARSILDHH